VLFDGLLALVLELAGRYEHRAEPARLIRAGLGGVRPALDTWEPAKGFRLDVFATWWIRHAITRDLAA
jgi:RNA polymerase primary sigma factor